VPLPSGNRIIDACRADAASLFSDEASVVTLERDQLTTIRDSPMTTVDFPLTATLAVVASLEDGSTGEVASIGTEGFVEIDAALHFNIARRSSLCLFAGQVIRVPLTRFQRALREHTQFANHVYHAVRSRVYVSEQLVVCGVRHSTSKRLARWLLLASERPPRQKIAQTHEQLAAALGVRRASISVEANDLQRAGAITYHRGVLTIVDRDVLHERACECYDICSAAFTETTPAA
jgi:CRP-like cAMP-binding protein